MCDELFSDMYIYSYEVYIRYVSLGQEHPYRHHIKLELFRACVYFPENPWAIFLASTTSSFLVLMLFTVALCTQLWVWYSIGRSSECLIQQSLTLWFDSPHSSHHFRVFYWKSFAVYATGAGWMVGRGETVSLKLILLIHAWFLDILDVKSVASIVYIGKST